MPPQELVRKLVCWFAKGSRLDRRREEHRKESESYLQQISRDLEELTYLYGLAEHIQYCDVSHTVAEVAQMILPQLRQVINAEAVALVPALHDAASPDRQTGRVGSPVAWVGPRILDDNSCSELVRRLQDAASDQPVVRNRVQQSAELAGFPAIDSFLLTPVVQNDCFIGWLLTLNRSANSAFGGKRLAGPACGLSECDFGTAEAGLARAAALVLATHGRNVEMFRIMRKARAQAEASNRAKTEFLANMSHEIRTPLNAILGYVDVLIEESWGRSVINKLEIIKRNGENLLHIVSDILDLSKIEAEKVDVELVPHSLLRLLDDVASLMKIQADAKGLEFKIEFAGPIPETIQTDPMHLRQILLNLVSNAIKFTDRGSVRLVAHLVDKETSSPSIVFSVIDTGIGMTQEEIGRVFQPFVQADGSTARRYGGTGLGLVLSKRLAEILGGDVSVACVAGKGCTFRVSVPTGPLDGVALIDRPQDANLTARDAADEEEPATSLNLHILLAEDSPDNQRLTSLLLRKAGARVTLAENGKVALDLALAARAEGTPFDAILMDMQMPEMDGYEATRRLRASEYHGPIIAFTAHALSGDRKKCVGAGCNDHMEKPITREKLIAVLATYNRQSKSAMDA